MTIQQAFEVAIQHHRAGRLAEAEAIYRQLLAIAPQNPDLLRLLGELSLQRGNADAALDFCTRAIALNPAPGESYFSLGNAHFLKGQFGLAVAAYQAALARRPGDAEAHYNLGNALSRTGRFPAAMDAYREALRHRPDHDHAHNNLGVALAESGQFAEAAAAHRAAIAIAPGNVMAHMNLGSALLKLGEIDMAVEALRTAIRMDPGNAPAFANLGNALREQGGLAEAVDAYRSALTLAPENAAIHSNLVYASHFLPGLQPGALAEEHRRWQQRHEEPLKARMRPHSNERSPERRLRIGYVSPDFRNHVVGRNLLPLFGHHDTTAFETVCYSDCARPDATTARLRSLATEWHETNGVSDEELAARIRGDRIDILVDLTLHMAGNRLPAFARKPAPVQATFAGYPSTTGLKAIDYLITDPYLDPAGPGETADGEKSLRLASFWCFAPYDSSPSVNALPALESGVITFGCLNAFCKVNDRVTELWSRILNGVAGSRLLMLSPLGGHRERTLRHFESLGISRERVEFVPRAPCPEYLALHRRLDIVLDTFPYNGHSTSLDALWMGVPVVSLAGQTAVSRGGLSILSNAGLPELVADTEEKYAAIASSLARDLPRLAELRAALRARMEASVLMDASRFTRDIEAAYRTMWRRWCAGTELPQ